MTCPQGRLPGANIILLGLNPGGKPIDATESDDGYDEIWSCEDGNAYWHEAWENPRGGRYATGGAPLQVQVKRLVEEALGRAEADLFSAQLVPFRSANWASLPNGNRDASLEFSRGLWAWALQRNQAAPVIFSLGHKAGEEAARLLNITDPPVRIGCGWPRQSIRRYQGGGRTIVSLPHLSRYQIFGRPGRPAERALSETLQGVMDVNLGALEAR